MRKTFTIFFLILAAVVLQGCARDASAPNTAAPKEGASAPAAAKPSPSPNDPAIKPPTKSQTP